jgi:membrane protease YdiL (CAAX protease family)
MCSSTISVKPAKFFVLTFTLSWLIWIPLALSHFGIGPFHISEGISNIVRLLGVLMPAVSALLLIAHAGGRDALRNLFSRLVLWRVHWKWWIAATLIQPALLGLTALLFNLFGGSPPVSLSPTPSLAALIVSVIFLLIATLGEEIGWHGIALPALQQQRSALKASVILGLLWAAWHLPFWLLLDTFDQFGIGYVGMNFLLVLPLTFYSTWFFNHAKSSILLTVAFHLTFNILNASLLQVTTNIGAFWLFIAFEWMIAILLFPHLEPGSADQNLRGGSASMQESP